MRQFMLLGPAVCVVAMGCAGEEEPPVGLAKWQGSWSEVSYVHDGAKPPPEHFVELITTFNGGKFVRRAKGQVVNQGEIRPSADGTPQRFEGRGTGPDGKDSPYKGIYAFKGDQLVMCFDPTGKTRPEKFESPSGSGFILIVFERLKE